MKLLHTEIPVNSLEELSEIQMVTYIDLLHIVKNRINRKFSPNGYNIGHNEGEAAGELNPGLVVHVIPRYDGDVDDPVGGVRTILPLGNYKKVGLKNYLLNLIT